jgi:hypothetical protein
MIQLIIKSDVDVTVNSGPMISDLRNQNFLDKVTYQCCGRVQTGTSPILLAAEPCKVRNTPPTQYAPCL